MCFRSLAARMPFAAAIALLSPGWLVELRAENGDVLATVNPVPGKEITGLCADLDGGFWAVGESTGKIYHLDATLAKIGEIDNPHGPAVFPDMVLARGIAFRPSTNTLLVLASTSAGYRVREVDLTGVEVAAGAFTIDTSALPGANLYGIGFDPLVTAEQLWLIDDANDTVVRVGIKGAVINKFSLPGDVPAITTLRGSGIGFRRKGITPYLYVTYGDIFTIAPHKIMELTVIGKATGVEVPLDHAVASPGATIKKIGAISIGTFNGQDAAFVIGEKGAIYVLEMTKPAVLPPSPFTARLTTENQVTLNWINHGYWAGDSYKGGIQIFRNGVRITDPPLGGATTKFVDDSPPANGTVTYSIVASDMVTLSPPATTTVIVGKGGLIRWIPFPGTNPFDCARAPDSGDLFVTDPTEGKIYRFDKNLELLGEIPSPIEKPGGIAYNPNGATGIPILMITAVDSAVMRAVDLDGNPIDLKIPIDMQSLDTDSPRIAGLVYNTETKFYTCIETSTSQLFSFDGNGQPKGLCKPNDPFNSKKLATGLGYDTATGNLYASYYEGVVGELYTNCTVTNFSFDLSALGELVLQPDLVRGIEVAENTLIVCVPGGSTGTGSHGALFQLLIVPRGKTFVRGDFDGSGRVNITDAVMIAEYLFRGGKAPDCPDAADANDDGVIDISDPVYILFWLFVPDSPTPPMPYPNPGNDPTFLDGLEC